MVKLKPGERLSTLRGEVEKKKERSWRVTVSRIKGYFQNLYIYFISYLQIIIKM